MMNDCKFHPVNMNTEDAVNSLKTGDFHMFRFDANTLERIQQGFVERNESMSDCFPDEKPCLGFFSDINDIRNNVVRNGFEKILSNVTQNDSVQYIISIHDKTKYIMSIVPDDWYDIGVSIIYEREDDGTFNTSFDICCNIKTNDICCTNIYKPFIPDGCDIFDVAMLYLKYLQHHCDISLLPFLSDSDDESCNKYNKMKKYIDNFK